MVGIVGSYREGGVIDTVVGEILAIAERNGKSTQKVLLADYDVGFCTNCRACMQSPGFARVPCVVHHDDAEKILKGIENADSLVIGAPVNMGQTNALMQQFIERSVGFGYWPWGTAGGPKLRNSQVRHTAVLVSSSAAPAFMNNRLFGVSAVLALKRFARLVGAKVVAQIKIGLVTDEQISLSVRTKGQIDAAARKLLQA